MKSCDSYAPSAPKPKSAPRSASFGKHIGQAAAAITAPRLPIFSRWVFISLSGISYPREHPAAERTAQRDEQHRSAEVPDQDDCARVMLVKNRQGGRSHGGHGEAARNRDPRRREQRRVTQHDEHGERERHSGHDKQREAPGLVAEGKTARLKAHPVGQTPIAYGRYPHEDRRER